MRYQLRYVRAQRTRSSPGANDDDSRPEREHTNLLESCRSNPASPRVACGAFREVRLVLVFDLVRLSAPVPWLSGRASASHAEGRWFDPSRDHPRSRRQGTVSSLAKQARCYPCVMSLSRPSIDFSDHHITEMCRRTNHY